MSRPIGMFAASFGLQQFTNSAIHTSYQQTLMQYVLM